MVAERTRIWLVAALLMALGMPAGAQDDDGNALAAQIANAQLSLSQALRIGQTKGRPLAARFEVADGELRVTVIANSGKDTNTVYVDPVAGSVRKLEAVTDPHGIKKTRGYAEAMARATLSLESAIKAAEGDNEGSQAVGVTPALVKGRAVAHVILLRGTELSTVDQRLQ
jgi:hypothetical protein